MGKKLVIFNINKRTVIAAGHIHANSEWVNTFMKTLTDAIEALDADPSNTSLSKDDKDDFLRTFDELDDDDDTVIIESEKKIHSIDDFM